MVRYDDFKLEQYVNTNPVGVLNDEEFYFSDIILAMELGKLNGILRGPKSAGKTQLMRDICNGHFGGEKHSLWETGRTDFRPRDLFERLNLSIAKGTFQSMPEIKPVFKDGKVSYLVSTFNIDDSGKIIPAWQIVSKDEVDKIIRDYSTTTDNLVQSKNIDKNFFAIDEYNRCPEIVMNLFYGLMTGETNRDGLVQRLGNGYYSGLAAVNPEDYEGTFTMDAAMWARFHVVLDFGAYPITVKDKDELTKRNLSPDVHNSTVKDLSSEIFAFYRKIKEKEPTVEERIILQYLQSGLDRCTKDKKSKELLDWPRYCASENCSKQTKLCGTMKGLDARAVRAVYRLAKGLEEVVKLKKDTGDQEIDPVESFSMAFQFVAPYKGLLHPKEIKEAMGIEALLLKEKMPSIKDNLGDVVKSYRRIMPSLKDSGRGRTRSPTRKEFDKLGKADDYDKIVDSVDKKYTVRKTFSVDELLEELPDLYREKLRESFLERVKGNLPQYEEGILDLIERENKEIYDQLISLKTLIGNDLSPNDLKEKIQREYNTTMGIIIQRVVESVDILNISKILPIPEDDVKEIIGMVKSRLPDKSIEFIPEDKKVPCEKEKQKELARKFLEIVAESHKAELEKLKDEKFFLKHFLTET